MAVTWSMWSGWEGEEEKRGEKSEKESREEERQSAELPFPSLSLTHIATTQQRNNSNIRTCDRAHSERRGVLVPPRTCIR